MTSILQRWDLIEFESSSELTLEFAAFAQDFLDYLEEELPAEMTLTFHQGHFTCMGFFRHRGTERVAYWNLGDVRECGPFAPGRWARHRTLIRTAKNEQDYTGGPNQFVSLDALIARAQQLTT